MRVRPIRPTDRRPARAAAAERRPHVIVTTTPAAAAPVAAVEVEVATVESRHRACGTSQDAAWYGCSCGFQFSALVTTSVACPQCGTAQAW